MRSPRWLTGLWVLVATNACDPRLPPPAAPRPAPQRAAPEPARTPTSQPPAPRAPAPPTPEPPRRQAPTAAEARALAAQDEVPPRPKGPGLRCGDIDCRPGWFCCLGKDDAPRCLPQSQAKSCNQQDQERLRGCDDAGDCGAGNVCCESRNVEGSTSCRPMKDCTFKLCAGGDTCLHPDYVCLSDGSSVTGGRCVYRKGTAACGLDAPCSGDAPWCLWDPPTQSGECVEPLPSLSALRCSSEKDCPSELACCWIGLSGGDAHCGSSCLDLGASTRLLCSGDDECRYLTQLTAQLGDPRPWRCLPVPNGEAPPGVKACAPPD